MLMRLASELPLVKRGEPPREFKIWSFGKLSTSKGDFEFSRVDAKSVMRAYRHHGQTDLPIDYNHDSVSPEVDGARKIAAGWFRPELRPDGLWAANVRWTASAARGLVENEWRLFSPAFEVADEGKHITRLVNIALTNLPATRHLTPLVAASATAKGPMADTEDIEIEKEAEHSEPDGDEADESLASDDKDEVIAALREELARVKMTLAKLEDEQDETETAAEEGEDEDAVEASDDPDEPAKTESMSKLSPAVLKALRTAGVTASAKSADGALIGLAMAHSKREAELAKLQKRVRMLSRVSKSSKIDQAIKDGKALPAERDFLLTLSSEQIDAFISVSRKPVRRAQPTIGSTAVQLSAQEQAIVNGLGITPDAYQAAKVKRSAQ